MAILGTVVSINGLEALVGKVMVLKANGDKVPLKLNDTVDPGDTIITPKGVIVELELVNGKIMQIFAEQTVKVTEELADAIPPSTGDSAVDYATIQSVIKAINEGRDINEVLEETAAGNEGGSGVSEGHGFIDLARILEPTTDLNFPDDRRAQEEQDIEPGFSEPNDANVFDDGTGTGGSGGPAPIPSIAIDDVSRNEGAGTITFTVSLSTPSFGGHRRNSE